MNESDWLGRSAAFTAPECVGEASIRYFAVALQDRNRLWVDDEYARSWGLEGRCAPPTFICETNQYMPGVQDSEGYGGFSWAIPNLMDMQSIRVRHAYEFHRPLYPADVITAEWRLDELRTKASAAYGEAVELVSAIRYTNQAGVLLATHQETMYYVRPRPRTEKDDRPPSAQPPPSPVDALTMRIGIADMAAYAGATWDWHRVHYDYRYAERMGLPGPLIDGQMFGAIMARHLTTWAGPAWDISAMQFRLRSMVFAGAEVVSRILDVDGGCELGADATTSHVTIDIADSHGRVAASGDATLQRRQREERS